MAKLTDEQIESTITQSHANILAVAEVSRDPRVIDPCITRELRACFTAGQDHGQDTVLERAASLMGDNVADARVGQLGRAMVTILAWVDAHKGRLFGGLSRLSASVLLGDDEMIDGFHFHYVYGDSPDEALGKLATWCTEHAVAHPVTVAFDNEPTEPNNARPERSL